MKYYKEDGCSLEDWIYPDGSQMCCEGNCMICKGGEWQELDEQLEEAEPAE